MKTTKQNNKYWKDRKIDWKKEYLDTFNHPHREVISSALTSFPWISLLEIGMGAGANLVNICSHFPGKQLGGVDINPDAVAVAEKALKGAILKVGDGSDVMWSDNMADVIITDMYLIYIGPRKIGKYLREIMRLGRNQVVFCEFHSKSWWQRFKMRLSGYNVYDYKKLLTKHGFYDTITIKMKDYWGGEPQRTFAHIIIAKIPRR